MSPSDADVVLLKLEQVSEKLEREIKDVKDAQTGAESRLRAAETWIARGQGAVGLLTVLASSGIVALLLQHT